MPKHTLFPTPRPFVRRIKLRDPRSRMRLLKQWPVLAACALIVGACIDEPAGLFDGVQSHEWRR